MHARTYTNTHCSYNLEGRRGNPKQPAVPDPGLFVTVSSQTRSGISVSAQTRLRFKPKNQNQNFALVLRAVSTAAAVFQLMVQKEHVPQPVGILKV